MEVRLKVAMGQMLVEAGQPDRNLARAIRMIHEAGKAGCGVIVLPECLDLGWTDPSAAYLAEPIPGPRSRAIGEAARDAGVYVVAGLTERSGADVFNAAVLLSPDGTLLLRHRKINELEIALPLYSTGTDLSVARTPAGAIGIPICADNFPDSIVFGESLARMGAQLLLSPCAWAVDADHDNVREPYGQLWLDAYVPLARRYGISVIAVSGAGWLTGGPWAGRKCIGCSLAVGPTGQVLMRGPYGESAEALLLVDVPVHPPIAQGDGFAAALRRRKESAATGLHS